LRRLLFAPNPHLRLDRAWAASYTPLELLSAMAVAEGQGAEPALFDVNLLVEHGRLNVGPAIWPDAANMAAEAEPDLILLETWTGTLHNTLLLARSLRQRLPETPLLLAGAGTSALAVETLSSFTFLDGVIRGELEPAVEVLARTPRCGRVLPEAPGLVRRVWGEVQDAPHAWVEDLEQLPRAAYHLALLQPGDAIPMEPGRGCARGCNFCALAGHWPAIYRPREPASLADEMLALGRRYPGSLLDLTQDPVFFCDEERTAALCERLGTQGPRWTCHARPDQLSPAQLKQMARAGCSGLLLGVESGCPDTQHSTGKEIDLDRLGPCLEVAERLGLEARCTFILGWPEEDRASAHRTVEVMVRALHAGAASVGVEMLRAFPGSQIHDQLASNLELEPLLLTAAPHDAPAMALIEQHPELLSASYRTPGSMPRGEVLALWVALSGLCEPLLALHRHGVSLSGLLAGLRLDPVPDTLLQATQQVAARLEILALEAAPDLNPTAWRDLLTYHLSLLELGEHPDPEPLGQAGISPDQIMERPDQACPLMVVPARVLRLSTDIDRLLDGQLTAPDKPVSAPILVARIPSPGDVSHYTRRSSALETFQLDNLGARLVRVSDGRTPLATLANTLAAERNEPPRKTARACQQVVQELVEAGVMVVLEASMRMA